MTYLRTNLTLFCLVMGLCLSGIAQAAGGDVLWPYDNALAGKQEAMATAVDSLGNMIVVGYTDSNNNDYYVAKVKSDGSGTHWTIPKDSTGGADIATAVTVDSNDDVIVTGYLWNGATYSDIYTAKYAAADGAIIWQHTFDGAGNGNDYAAGVAVDSINNVYVGGTTQDATAKDSFIVLKFGPDGPNPDGTPLWTASYDAGVDGHDRVMAIAAGPDGVAVTGESQNSTPDFDCATVKYGFDGSQIWVRRYSDTGDGRGKAVAIDSAGNVIMAGYVSNGSNTDFYVIKYAADDSPAIWVKMVNKGNNDEATALWIDSSDDVYAVGTVYEVATGNDIYFAKYTSAGVESWSDSFNSAASDGDTGLHIIGDNDGELFVAGYSHDNVGTLDDYLVVKLKRSDGTTLWNKEYDGATHNDRVAGIGLAPDGNLLVGGWSDRWTASATDYDFYLIKYESGALNKPTSLTATTITNTRIDLAWSDNSSTEENYIVEQKIGAAGTYAVIATLAAGTESYSNTDLSNDTRYYYRVKAFSVADGSSPYSNEVNAKTTVISYSAPALSFTYNGGADGEDYAQAIATGADNHPVVTGFSTGLGTGFDYYTIKFDRANVTDTWNDRYNDGDNEMDVANAITVDSNNRVVVTGYSSLYGGGAGNTNDVYTIGYLSTGPPSDWTDQYNGPDGDDDRSSAVSAATDGSDNTVVVGYGKNASFDDDIYVIKFQADGTRLWVATPHDGGNDDYPADVVFDPSGDIFVGGYSHNGTNKDFFVAKYAGASGVQTWAVTFNGLGNGDDYINAIAVDAAGDLYVTGYSVSAAGNGDIYTIKYDGSDGSNGTILWQKPYNGPGNAFDIGDAVQFDPVDGNILVGGTVNISAGDNDYHLIRYDAAGNVVWQKTLDRLGSDEALVAMSIDRSGTVCLTGTTDISGNDDVLTVKYDSDGIIIGASVYAGAASDIDSPAAIATNSYGETFVAGFTTNASGNTDYLVFAADGVSMQAPTPFTATQLYTRVDLAWADNSLNETGFTLERKVGTCSSGNPWTSLYDAAAGETSYINTNLSIGSTFCYRIRSFNGSGESSRWAELEVTTANPIAPSGLMATVQNTTDILLGWTDNTGSEDGFTLERCLGAACGFSSITSIDIAAGETSYTDTSACYGLTYSYRIKSYKTGEWTTAVSNVDADNTTDLPQAPTGFSVTWISEVEVQLDWTDNSDDETGFKIERCLGSGCSDFAEVSSVVADVITDNDDGLLANSIYRYRVTPYKTATCTVDPAYSPIQDVTTTPAAPGSLSATVVNSTQVNLDWVDNTASEDGFKIERCSGSGCSSFSQISTASAGATRFVDDTVCAGTDYRYQIRAYRSGLWDTVYTSIVDVSVSTPPTPASYSVTAVSEEGIDLSWDLNGADPNGYLIERCSGASCTGVAQIDDISTGRVLYLPMEELSWDGTADEVKDGSGNDNHARSYNGAQIDNSGKFGWAGDFDGTNDYLTTALTIDQTSGGAGATYEAWVYPEATNNTWRTIISTENGGYDWSLMQYGTTWRIYHGSNQWSAGSVTVDTWQHLVAVFEPGVGVRFYKNGVKATSSNIAYDSSTNPINIGRRSNGSYYFDGKIDEVMVYSRALSDAEVLARYNSGTTQSGTLSETYSNTGLSPDTTYGYLVKSYRNNDCSGVSPVESTATSILYATTLSPPPPTGLALSTPNTTQVDLTWTDNTDSETGFVLERCIGSGIACDDDIEFSSLTTTAADVTSYSDLTACSGTTYTYRVAAEKTNGPNWQTTWNVSSSASTVAPATPSDFAATASSEVQIDLNWSDTLADEESYRVEKCVGSGTDCDEDSEFSLLVNMGDRDLPNEATLWLKMDEASWGSVINSGTAGSNGVKVGNSAIQTNIDGRDSVGWFDGSGDYLQFNHYSEINPTAAITVSIWARSYNATWQHDHALMSKRNAFILSPRAGDTGMRFYIYSSGWRVIDVSGIAVDITEWHLYTGTYDGSNVILYVDGVEVGRTPYVGTINADTGVVQIGRDDGQNRYHRGWLDDAMIFNRALGASEVLGLMTASGAGNYADSGLTPATDYTYRLRAAKTASCPWATSWITETATTMAPPAPTDLVLVATDTSTIDLTWTDNSGSETSYNLERCPGSGTACDEDAEFSTLDATLAVDSASFTDDTVCENTTYSYRVRAEKSDGPVWQTTWAGPLAQTATGKATPTGLAATRVSEVQIDLSWSDSNGDETGFKIERCTGAGCSVFGEVADAAAGSSAYQDDQLDPDTSYSYRIKAYKTADCPWETSYTGTVTETTDVTVPSGLSATTVNTTRIDLAWTDNTSTETATVVERCTGSGCSGFAELADVGANLTAYSDTSICYGTTYNYRLKVKNEGLSGDGGSCWTNRVPLSFSSFAAGVMTSITVPYDSDMRSDFGDLRFYDDDGKRELHYYIQDKTDGVTATVLLRLGDSQNINMYYGNAAATDAGSEAVYLLFEDDFAGTVIDTSKWVEIDPNNSFGQNDDLLLIDVSDAWNKALISQASFSRVVGREMYVNLTISADTAGNNRFMVGWELNQTSNASYNQLVHGMYWNNYTFNTYERGTSRGGSGSYAASTTYEMKIVLKSNGAVYYVKGGAYASWTLVRDNTFNSDATMRIAFTQYSQQANVHSVKVYEATTATGVTLGSEESNACYSYSNTWERGYSNQDEATTTSPSAPSGLTAIAITDTQIDLAWTDNTDVETGFKIERCTGSGCSDFAQIDTVAGNVTSYSDLSAPDSTDCSYRVRAYKSATCSWDSSYSNTATDRSFPAASGSLTATALNSRMIKLDWDDDASDEDGYELEVLAWNGIYTKIADLPPDSVTFTDTMAINGETEYSYRIRPYRGSDMAPYSNVVTVTTPAYNSGDNTCP